VIRAIRKLLDKLPTSPGLIRAGQWRVLYHDGNWSVRMTYDIAKDYAGMFGGTVRHIRYDDPATPPESKP